MQQNRQQYGREVQEDRQEFYEDNYYGNSEWYEDRWRFAVGASITAAAFRSMTCTPTTVIVNGTTYYNCSGTWYNRAYSGGSVTYIVVNAPPGQ